MENHDLAALGIKTFEETKKENEYGAEYWSARELQPLLGYTQWRRFEEAIQRAITSCKQSGNDPSYHFAGVGKMIGHRKRVHPWSMRCQINIAEN
ncbi:MAG: hypothetical protein HZA16_02440 [Nitrospirae bacterium]|nr:hypothetical protein [Nitrospirota bacterium]MBI5739555.1 hypothetical protein [Nitrospirota bacterium]